MSAILYRDAGVADAAAVADLFRICFIDTFAHLYRAEDLEAFLATKSADMLRREMESGEIVVRIAEADGRLAGFAKLGPASLPVENGANAAELRQLYVLKPWQGGGIARTLMDWVLEEARRREARELFLSVYVDNVRARRFYERYGFRFVAPYAFMVGSQADEDHILRLELGEARA